MPLSLGQDGLVTSDLDDLVAAYWRYARLAGSADRADRLAASEWDWAKARVDEAVAAANPSTLDLLDALLRSEDGTPERVGVGPLEDLLTEHGADVAMAVAERADADPLWRRAVAACRLDREETARLPDLRGYLDQP